MGVCFITIRNEIETLQYIDVTDLILLDLYVSICSVSLSLSLNCTDLPIILQAQLNAVSHIYITHIVRYI